MRRFEATFPARASSNRIDKWGPAHGWIPGPMMDGQSENVPIGDSQARRNLRPHCIVGALSRNTERSVARASINSLCVLVIDLLQFLIAIQRDFPGEFFRVRGSFNGGEHHSSVIRRQRWLSQYGRCRSHRSSNDQGSRRPRKTSLHGAEDTLCSSNETDIGP